MEKEKLTSTSRVGTAEKTEGFSFPQEYIILPTRSPLNSSCPSHISFLTTVTFFKVTKRRRFDYPIFTPPFSTLFNGSISKKFPFISHK